MKKSQKSTEITPLETALQKQFKADAGIVRKAFDLVEENRSAFAVNALKFGLCALAAKSIVGHGKFGKWLSEALSDNGNLRPMAERTAKDYMGLAKVFVDKFSTPNKLPVALSEGIDDVCGRYAIARSDFKINEFLADHEKTSELLDSTVRGMTLTQLRQLLREGAERAYSDEQAEQSKPQPKNNLHGLQGRDSSGGQMTFFNELFDEVRATIEIKRVNDPRFLQLSKEEMGDLGNYLIEQGKAILNLAKEKQE